MIRKPDDRDFKEGAAINALRQTGDMGLRTAKTAARGTQKVLQYWFAGITSISFAAGGLSIGSPMAIGIVLIVFGIAFWAYKFHQKAKAAQKANFEDNQKFYADIKAEIEAERRICDAATRGQYTANTASVAKLPPKTYHYDVLHLLHLSFLTLILPIGGPTLLSLLGISYFADLAETRPLWVAGGFACVSAALLYGLGSLWLDRAALVYDSEGLTIRRYWGTARVHWLDVRELEIKGTNAFLNMQSNNNHINIYAPNNRFGKAETYLIPMAWFGKTGAPRAFLNDLHADMMHYWKTAQERDVAARERQDLFTRPSTPSHNPTTSYQPMAIAPDPQPIVHDDLAAVRAEFAARRQAIQSSADADTVDHMRPRAAGFGRKGL